MSARSMFDAPMVQDPATTIRILREKLLDALRLEKAALIRAASREVSHG